MKHFYILSLCLIGSISWAFSQACGFNEDQVIINITTDNFPQESSWQLTNPADGSVYAEVNAGEYTSQNTMYSDTVCIPSNLCTSFSMMDSFGDGMCCSHGNGGYEVVIGGNIVASGGDIGNEETTFFNCPPGSTCSDAAAIGLGTYTAPNTDYWYEFTAPSSGMYLVTTCNLASCDTKIWIYDTCSGIIVSDINTGTIYYDNDNGGCGDQANINALFEEGITYIIRIGEDSGACNSGPIDWSLTYVGPVSGCMDPMACNYNPVATISDGSCIYQGDPNCPNGPDLVMRQDVLETSIYLSTIDNTDNCMIEEGCINGYGVRDIVRFSTRIDNTGEADYYIGSPTNDPSQFTYDNCHGHNHYDGYAEYILYDEMGTELPIGFKNGFCVIDLGCMWGSAQYGCGNMGISAGCYDEYWAELECQWIDVTDVADGTYTFVTRVNWDNAPDALGQMEVDFSNNWAQVCISLDRSSGSLVFALETDCDPYVDCAGEIYGSAQPDCTGECAGTVLMGDLNQNTLQEMVDAQSYVTDILGEDISPTPCNDLNADNLITVYDAALLTNCLNYGAAHAHDGGGAHDHCNFPDGIYNSTESVDLTILDINTTDGYVDVGIINPLTEVVAYQFTMSGLMIQSVENLVDPTSYPINPQGAVAGEMVIGISYQDSLVDRSITAQPLCRIHYMGTTNDTICIDQIIEVVNGNYEQVVTNIVDGCVDVSVPLSTANAAFVDALEIQFEPNPFKKNTRLKLNNPSAKTYDLEILDLSGKSIRSYQNLQTDNFKIERDGLAAGVYLYRVIFEEGTASGRIIAQ